MTEFILRVVAAADDKVEDAILAADDFSLEPDWIKEDNWGYLRRAFACGTEFPVTIARERRPIKFISRNHHHHKKNKRREHRMSPIAIEVKSICVLTDNLGSGLFLPTRCSRFVLFLLFLSQPHLFALLRASRVHGIFVWKYAGHAPSRSHSRCQTYCHQRTKGRLCELLFYFC
jgi:hypothetical protein